MIVLCEWGAHANPLAMLLVSDTGYYGALVREGSREDGTAHYWRATFRSLAQAFDHIEFNLGVYDG